MKADQLPATARRLASSAVAGPYERKRSRTP
jgi:hypothetical protein